ncbi:hypothetical protein BC835DRAFT_1328534 [Cytidiella melzeri]|nr:hypothetical protein BC835DRAFT_1328534 [Cytidiella melzeri]
MVLPPKSGRKAVRLRNVSILVSLLSLNSDIVIMWISCEGKTNIEKPRSTNDWFADVRVKIVTIATQLQTLKQQTALENWVSSIRGVWPIEEYMKLADQETRMMANLAWLGSALAQLNNETLARPLVYLLKSVPYPLCVPRRHSPSRLEYITRNWAGRAFSIASSVLSDKLITGIMVPPLYVELKDPNQQATTARYQNTFKHTMHIEACNAVFRSDGAKRTLSYTLPYLPIVEAIRYAHDNGLITNNARANSR